MRIFWLIGIAACAGLIGGSSCSEDETQGSSAPSDMDGGELRQDARALMDGPLTGDSLQSRDGSLVADGNMFDSEAESALPDSDNDQTCPPGAECEDFETGRLDGPWQLPGTDTPNVHATTRIETGRAHSGRYAFHITTEAVSTDNTAIWGTITRSIGFPSSSANAIYFRAYVYLPPLGDKPFVLFHLAKTAEGKVAELMAMKATNPGPGGPDLLMTESNNVGGTSLHFDTATLPTNLWTCIEWMLSPNSGPLAGNGKTKAWVNDRIVLDYADIGTMAYPRVWVGFVITHLPASGIGSLNAWIDDVATSDHRIGCN